MTKMQNQRSILIVEFKYIVVQQRFKLYTLTANPSHRFVVKAFSQECFLSSNSFHSIHVIQNVKQILGLEGENSIIWNLHTQNPQSYHRQSERLFCSKSNSFHPENCFNYRTTLSPQILWRQLNSNFTLRAKVRTGCFLRVMYTHDH